MQKFKRSFEVCPGPTLVRIPDVGKVCKVDTEKSSTGNGTNTIQVNDVSFYTVYLLF